MEHRNNQNIRNRIYKTIFKTNTHAGRIFDIVLIACILISTVVIMLESVDAIKTKLGTYLSTIEWFFTILFTFEYLLRILVAKKKIRYIFSFFGIVDLLSVIPSYISMALTGQAAPLILRSIRLVRAFKLVQFIGEERYLIRALQASQYKITIFFLLLVSFSIISGAIMYLIEGPEHGFTNIPQSVYWAVVTLTTVGYGDIVPHTSMGQIIGSIIMILGHGVVTIPAAFVAAEMVLLKREKFAIKTCPKCYYRERYGSNAKFCAQCGTALEQDHRKNR